MNNIKLTNMKTIIESTELKSIKEIYNQPLFSDYYIKTWPILNNLNNDFFANNNNFLDFIKE